MAGPRSGQPPVPAPAPALPRPAALGAGDRLGPPSVGAAGLAAEAAALPAAGPEPASPAEAERGGEPAGPALSLPIPVNTLGLCTSCAFPTPSHPSSIPPRLSDLALKPS